MQGKTKQSLSMEQDIAANPLENIWVQANAGTGKTSVLVRRLLRILFRTTADATGILCLTYTNAGAAEMRNRILASLRNLAMASDDELRDLLFGITTGAPTDDDLTRARDIFYTYIDNPDILKIKTIHGFCEEILHRFPTEAGIPPSWNLVSDSAQKILLHDAFHKLINSVSDKDTTEAFTHIVGRVSEHSFDDLLNTLTTQYKQFFKVKNHINYRKYFIDTSCISCCWSLN
jgi:ATP-dependent helicase/nuclease subunit A